MTGENNGYYADYGSLAALAKSLRNAFVYDGNYSKHRKRKHSAITKDLGGQRFIGYLQNHDQVGNRAQGERSSRLMSRGKLKIGAALVLTSPFIPMLFQGEEWGATTPFLFFTDHRDPEMAAAVGEGRCKEFAEFGWKPEEMPQPQARETFERSKLNWSELPEPAHTEMLDWHKRLIQLRRAEKDLNDGQMKRVLVEFDENKNWLVVERGAISVACNFNGHSQQIPLRHGKCRGLLASQPEVNAVNRSVMLPAESVAICGRETPSRKPF
jgi:maltooligosyltrehalose trehalohydrolase